MAREVLRAIQHLRKNNERYIMKLKELFEGDVVKGNFGGKKNDSIEIPSGFESFYVEPTGDSTANIVGVKADKSEKVVKSGSKELMVAFAKEFNAGGKAGTGLQPISMMQAFGSEAMNILNDAGIKFMEKPDEFSELEEPEYSYKPLNDVTFKKVENELKKAGIELKTYSAQEIYGKEPNHPQVGYKNKPAEDICIVELSNGKRYLIDTTQANTYARMWILIK